MQNNYPDAVRGANYLLSDLHINSDFICEKEILRGSLAKYKVLILPCTYVISEACAEAIAEFVRTGGCVIADYILAEKRPGGLCYTSLPGAGLDRVFGIEREDVLFIAHRTMERENRLGIETGSMIEQIILTDAKSIGGEYMPDYPLMSKNAFGEGDAVYIAAQYFANYCRKPTKIMREVLLELLAELKIYPHASLALEDQKPQSALITSKLSSDGEDTVIITVTNTDYETIGDSLVLPADEYKLIELEKGHKIKTEGGKTVLEFTLGALESLVIYKEKESI